jgi:hypothetical protein
VPALIKKRYEALARSLDLETSNPQFYLEDSAVPVVLIHEHCEGDCFGYSNVAAGNTWPTTIVSSLNSLAVQPGNVLFKAQAYQMLLYASWDMGVAATEDLSFKLYASGGITLATLWAIKFGFGPMSQGALSLLIPKIHVPEGSYLLGTADSAGLAADSLRMGFLLQPI